MLIRNIDLPANVKRLTDGPCAGGTFWAHSRAHDLPHGRFAYADPGAMLRFGDLYMRSVGKGWMKIEDLADLPKFSVEISGGLDERAVFLPFLPEFYFVPRGFRGSRLVRRAHNKARGVK